ncbi:MAG: hypothetical protein SO167_04885 [Bacilli bacterium]|nr:hypothetical protein [Bacilli bacterium]
MENKKIKIYGVVLGIILFILLISGLTYAILSWRSSNITITGTSECLEVESVKGSNITGSDLLLLDSGVVNHNQITITTGMVVTNITAKLKSSCTLDGYLTINLKTTTLNSGFTSSGNSTGALKYVLASYDPSTYTTISTSALNGKTFDIVTTGSITGTGTLKIKETQLSKDTTLAYLVIFYIDGDKANNDIGSNSTNFKTSIEATVTQGELPTLATQITNLYNAATKTPVTNNSITYQYDTRNNLMKDNAGNIRYYGASPNNYIYFNCSDYSNQSSSTCETWRIIGVFNNKVKLIRGSQIGTYSWDNKNTSTGAETGYGKNDWTDARLMKLLNPGYESETTGGSLYYNSGSGNCYAGENNATKACDFTSTGIKNDKTRGLISEETYSLLGWDDYSVYSNQMYEYERSTGKVYSGRPTEWQGKIALPYPSDYGYAVDLSKCGQDLYNYDNNTCTSNNWMKTIIAPNDGWLLTPDSGYAYYAWYVDSSGCVSYGSNASYANRVAPVLYLNSELSIKAGTGTGSSSAPYQLSA